MYSPTSEKSKNFIEKFRYEIINVHPSLLPKFKGLNPHKKVLKILKNKKPKNTVKMPKNSVENTIPD